MYFKRATSSHSRTLLKPWRDRLSSLPINGEVWSSQIIFVIESQSLEPLISFNTRNVQIISKTSLRTEIENPVKVFPKFVNQIYPLACEEILKLWKSGDEPSNELWANIIKCEILRLKYEQFLWAYEQPVKPKICFELKKPLYTDKTNCGANLYIALSGFEFDLIQELKKINILIFGLIQMNQEAIQNIDIPIIMYQPNNFEPSLIFDDISDIMYDIADIRRQYFHYIDSLDFLKISPTKLRLQEYKMKMDSIPLEFVTIPILLNCLLDQVCGSTRECFKRCTKIPVIINAGNHIKLKTFHRNNLETPTKYILQHLPLLKLWKKIPEMTPLQTIRYQTHLTKFLNYDFNLINSKCLTNMNSPYPNQTLAEKYHLPRSGICISMSNQYPSIPDCVFNRIKKEIDLFTIFNNKTDYLNIENHTKMVLLQQLYCAVQDYNCVDYFHNRYTDSLLLHCHFLPIDHIDWEMRLRSMITFKEFCDYILNEEIDWLKLEESNYRDLCEKRQRENNSFRRNFPVSETMEREKQLFPLKIMMEPISTFTGYDISEKRIQIEGYTEYVRSKDNNFIKIDKTINSLLGTDVLSIQIQNNGISLHLHSGNLGFHLNLTNGIILAFAKPSEDTETQTNPIVRRNPIKTDTHVNSSFETREPIVRTYKGKLFSKLRIHYKFQTVKSVPTVPFNFDFTCSFPNGLLLKTVPTNDPANPFYIKQKFNGKRRCFLQNGTILEFYNNGASVKIFEPVSTIFNCQIDGFKPTNLKPPKHGKRLSKSKKIWNKSYEMRWYLKHYKRMYKVAKKMLTVEPNLTPIPEYTVITPDGYLSGIWDGTRCGKAKQLIVEMGIDPITGDIYYEREDNTTQLLTSEGSLLTCFPDGTRILTTFSIEPNEICVKLSPEENQQLSNILNKTQQNEDVKHSLHSLKSKTKVSKHKRIDIITPEVEDIYFEGFVSVILNTTTEHPKFARVSYTGVGECRIEFGESQVLITKNGDYQVKLDSVTKLQISEDDITFSHKTCQECGVLNTSSIHLNPLTVENIDTMGQKTIINYDGTANRIKEVKSTTECGVTHLFSQKEEYFVLNRDLTGGRFATDVQVEQSIQSTLTQKIEGRVHKDDVRITLLHAISPSTWSFPYEATNIFPSFLKRKDMYIKRNNWFDFPLVSDQRIQPNTSVISSRNLNLTPTCRQQFTIVRDNLKLKKILPIAITNGEFHQPQKEECTSKPKTQ